MPIILPEGSASAALLRSEGIEVLHPSARPNATLRIGLLNLMPNTLRTEIQFARVLAAANRDVEIVLAVPQSYRPGHEATACYERWGETSLPPRLDGLIVTGAPLEFIPFEDVRYWRELVHIFAWATRNVGSTYYVCWAAFAALHAFHRVPMRLLPQKCSGVFKQQVLATGHPLMAGLASAFPCPVSRHAEVQAEEIPWQRGLARLAESPDSRLCLIADTSHNAVYMFNHLEYEADTLRLEYLRDCAGRAGNTLPHDPLSQTQAWTWRRSAETVFANWLAIVAAKAPAVPSWTTANLDSRTAGRPLPICSVPGE